MVKEKTSGIYCIENLVNGKKYIGQSIDLYERLRHHKSDLKGNRHKNVHLQKSYNKYGVDNFKIYIIELCSKDVLDEREIYYIDYYK